MWPTTTLELRALASHGLPATVASARPGVFPRRVDDVVFRSLVTCGLANAAVGLLEGSRRVLRHGHEVVLTAPDEG